MTMDIHDKSYVQKAQQYRSTPNSSAFMESVDTPSLVMLNNRFREGSQNPHILPPDVTLDAAFTSLKLTAYLEGDDDASGSFLLMDGQENIKVSSVDKFIRRLQCPSDERIKVVSIFGNTGDGKSHTLNHTFFNGAEIFGTSPEQNSCTLGVWAAYDAQTHSICLDTEGLLGVCTYDNQRTRMLLKVLAISDIVIYRTRSERLHQDMFTFLGGASKAFSKHFMGALKALGLPQPPSALGPAVIIFHETRNTMVLQSSIEKSAEDILRERFTAMDFDLEAFSSVRYVGLQTSRPPTQYLGLQEALRAELENTSVRSPRSAAVVYQTLKALNAKFSSALSESPKTLFSEEYFTCSSLCLSCEGRCQLSTGHSAQGEEHHNERKCRYQHQYENRVYVCKACHSNGRYVIVTPQTQTVWFGYVIDCPNCGEIYRSCQYWYGNRSPEETAVRTEIVHVWPGNNLMSKGVPHTAQRMLDGVSYITEAVANVSTVPTKVLTAWVTNQIAPAYWKPDSEITHCRSCKLSFDENNISKHHCRACGEGFCSPCSNWKARVPARGWEHPVRVCESCYRDSETQKELENALLDDKDVRARKYGEVVANTLSSVAAALEYPKALIKDSARPTYWEPDNKAPVCAICKVMFGPADYTEMVHSNSASPIPVQKPRHHCRSCGKAVCNECSLRCKPVPERGWSMPVRVCDQCCKMD